MVKRFIAGAVCPKCGAGDAIRAERNELRHVMMRECVECGFTDELYDNPPDDELQTRVTPRTQDDHTQTIKIIPMADDPSTTRH